MDSQLRLLKEYIASNGKNPFREWINSLRETKTQQIIDTRLNYVRRGTFGDCEPVGQGISELKIHHGPGYRIYFGQIGKTIVLLLCGGTKKTQSSDIQKAYQYWTEYRSRI